MKNLILQALKQAFKDEFETDYLNIEWTEEKSMFEGTILTLSLRYREIHLCSTRHRFSSDQFIESRKENVKELMYIELLALIMKWLTSTTENNLFNLVHKYKIS